MNILIKLMSIVSLVIAPYIAIDRFHQEENEILPVEGGEVPTGYNLEQAPGTKNAANTAQFPVAQVTK